MREEEGRRSNRRGGEEEARRSKGEREEAAGERGGWVGGRGPVVMDKERGWRGEKRGLDRWIAPEWRGRIDFAG